MQDETRQEFSDVGQDISIETSSDAGGELARMIGMSTVETSPKLRE